MAGKKQNLDPMLKIFVKEVDLGEPTSSLDQVYLRCTQRECKTSKDIADNFKDLFEFRMSAGGVEKIAESMRSNCSEMPVFGSHWKTRYFMVSDEACPCHHKMDESL